ncbi:Methionine import ATP-binding protein MetN [Propionicimonas sp. T2.31MG-18]|uniref:methionine ABC transporter ATP-binding protein n=1 Tax=Propionicimonas sp. T2.31MG-18 TaxID=3157620 RepID=UPI0035EA3646
MIAVTDLKKVYRQAHREVRALDGVTLAVPENSVHGVIGQSGAGKSTLVRCLALLDRPTEGTVEINGVELTSVRSDDLRRARRRLGVVFQHANLFDARTIQGNVAYPLELAGVGRAERTAKARELLGLVGLADTGGAYPAQLSGGQRQRVGIARALATDPDVLLCDEPTSALDPTTTGEILDLIGDLKARLGLAVLVITHEMQVVKRICDSVSLLESGRVVESGALTDVVGAFGSRLSETLIGLPATPAVDPEIGTTIEVLDVATDHRLTALTEASGHFGVDFAVVAATVERLGGTTFGRWRVLVRPPLDPVEVVAHLHRRGVRASLGTPGGEAIR